MGLSKELGNEVRSTLGVLVNGQPGSMIFTHLNMDLLVREAINHLSDLGAIEDLGTGSFRVTAYGREYWEQLKAPRRYFLQKNWFRIAGLAVPLILGLTAIIANVLF